VGAAAAGGSMALMLSEWQWGMASEAETELIGGSGAAYDQSGTVEPSRCKRSVRWLAQQSAASAANMSSARSSGLELATSKSAAA
jgi:hypothetical protein